MSTVDAVSSKFNVDVLNVNLQKERGININIPKKGLKAKIPNCKFEGITYILENKGKVVRCVRNKAGKLSAISTILNKNNIQRIKQRIDRKYNSIEK